MRWLLPLFCLLAAAPGALAADWVWSLPSYVPQPRVPEDNPMSVEKVALGHRLFYDQRLSGNGTLSCSSCHRQDLAFSDDRQLSPGSTGELTLRRAQRLANAAWHATFTWANPTLVTLERQMEVPLFGESPIEMGVTDANRPIILGRLEADSRLREEFHAAFPEDPRPLSFANIIKAIASFERSLISFDSKYDRYLRKKATLTPAEARGKDLFFGEKAECHHCHGSFNFDDQVVHAQSRAVETPFHNTGLYNLGIDGDYPVPNRGVYEISGRRDDMGAFRAPSLRNVAVTGPYMHDGSVGTLEEVLDNYAAGGRIITSGPNQGDGRANPHKDDLIVTIELDAQEKGDLIAFLRTLTDESLLQSGDYAPPDIIPRPTPAPDRLAPPAPGCSAPPHDAAAPPHNRSGPALPTDSQC